MRSSITNVSSRGKKSSERRLDSFGGSCGGDLTSLNLTSIFKFVSFCQKERFCKTNLNNVHKNLKRILDTKIRNRAKDFSKS